MARQAYLCSMTRAKHRLTTSQVRHAKAPGLVHDGGGLYAQRQHVECCIGKLKQFRRVATRYEKTARNFLAVVTIAAFVLWMR